ncbi:MAG: hypothetical protein GY722_16310 [bacterium]|nr:hypothetical protein [bacterium]
MLAPPLVYSQVFLDQELAFVELLPVEKKRIVERWDNMEPMPQGPRPNSGKF